MAATIVLRVCTGTNAATEATVTGITMRSNDSAANDTANPISIPSVGTNRSFEKWIRFMCTVAPAVQATNFKYWGPNTIPGTGTLLFVGTTATGVTPVATDSAVATSQQDTNHFSAGTALAVSGTLVNVNDETDFVVFQMDVDTTAGPGPISQQTHNYSYDEN